MISHFRGTTRPWGTRATLRSTPLESEISRERLFHLFCEDGLDDDQIAVRFSTYADDVGRVRKLYGITRAGMEDEPKNGRAVRHVKRRFLGIREHLGKGNRR